MDEETRKYYEARGGKPSEAQQRDETPERGFVDRAGDFAMNTMRDYNAAASAFIDSLSGGAAGNAADRLVHGYDTGSPWSDALAKQVVRTNPLLVGAVDAITGQPEREGGVNETLEQNQEGRPIWSLIGDILGGGVGGYGSAKVLRDAAEKGTTSTGRLVERAVQNPATRTAAATGAGTAEGAGYAINQQEPVMEGAAYGAIGGSAGQIVLGEVIPSLARAFDGSDRPKQGADYTMTRAGEALGFGRTSGREFPMDEVVQRRQQLGQEATLMDANPGFQAVGVGMYNSGEARPFAQEIAYRFGQGGPRRPEIPEQFQGEVIASLPLAFASRQYTPTNGGGPRSLTMIRDMAIKNRQEVAPEFGAALQNAPRRFTVNEVWNAIDEQVDFRKSTTNVSAAEDKLRATIDRLTQDSRAQGLEAGVQNPPAGDMDAGAVHVLRMELDEQASDAMRAGNRPLAMRLLEARRAVNDILIDNVPDFGRVNALYSEPGRYERAYEMTYKAIFDNKKDDWDMDLAMQHADPVDRPAFLEGAAAAIVDKLETNMESIAEGRKYLRNAKLQRKMTRLFGEEATKQITDAADRALTFSQTTHAVSGNSLTMPRAAEASAVETAFRRTALAAGMARILGGRYGGNYLTTVAPSSAYTYGAGARELKDIGNAAKQKLYPIVDHWLTQHGAKADEAAQQMLKLHETWYPTTSIAGLNFGEGAGADLMSQIKNFDVEAAPAAGIAAAGSRQAED